MNLKQIESCCNRFESRFRPTIRKDGNTNTFFKDFENLEGIIEKFLKV